MLNKLILIAFFVILTLGLYSQRPTLELTFTAIDNAAYLQLDSIKVINRTQGGDTILYWPDTVLSIYYFGVYEITNEKSAFNVFQNYPNPVKDQTSVSLYVPDKDKVSLIITDILGRVILKSDRVLDKGLHSFRFTPGSGNLYFFTALWQGHSSSIKILPPLSGSTYTGSLEYLGGDLTSPQLKAEKAVQGEFTYNLGDELLYIGYIGGLETGLLDIPQESRTYIIQFATNIPCPGMPTVEYEGQVYNTIQIFSQCWLKENLNVGEMIPGEMGQSNNGTIEKYCYNNEPDSCTKYGGLYQWWEMMQYTTQQGTRGICPPGWHLPTDEEWKVLEGSVDNQYGIGDPEWDISWDFRGYDAGTNLKTTSGWHDNGNGTDLFGFSGLPGGGRYANGIFLTIGDYGSLWSSTESDFSHAWFRHLNYYGPGVGRGGDVDEEYGFSVRCLRDN